MKIVAATYYQVRIPLKKPMITSYAKMTDKEFDLLILTDEAGYQGIGELSALSHPDYLAEFLVQERLVIQKYLLPQVLKQQNWDFSWLKGHHFAKATLEQCLFDLQAKRQQVSLRYLLNHPKDKLEVGVSLGIFTDQITLNKKVADLYAQGYRRFKFKVQPGLPWQWFKELKQTFPMITLWADANGAFKHATDAAVLALDEVGFALLEQPFGSDDFVRHASLQAKLQTPVCLDESLTSLAQLKTAHALGSCRVVNLKLGRVGGFKEGLRVLQYCQANNLQAWVGGMYESGVGRAFNWQFASQACFKLAGDLAPTQTYLSDDIINEKFVVTDGQITLPDTPGCGVSLDLAKLNYYSQALTQF